MTTFTCPICGKEYKTAAEMAACVVECDKELKNKDTAKKAAAQKIMDAYDNIKNMIDEFNSLYPEDSFSFSLTQKSTTVTSNGPKAKTDKVKTDLEAFLKNAIGDKGGDKKPTKRDDNADVFRFLDDWFKVF